jgi:hypothetical protein
VTMEMKPLRGSGMKAAGYDERNRKLEIEMAHGTFEYSNVSPEIYRRLMASPSPASYFKDAIEEEFAPRRIK